MNAPQDSAYVLMVNVSIDSNNLMVQIDQRGVRTFEGFPVQRVSHDSKHPM